MHNGRVQAEELRREAAAIRWFHTIDLGQGVVTPGQSDTPAQLARIEMPSDLTGKTVLDVGAWDGFFSFEAERRGARRVVAADHFAWHELPDWGGKRGFLLARAALGSNVEDVDLRVEELSPEIVGTFDVVLFLGVLYHLRDPLLALERVASVTRALIVLETHVDMIGTRRPAAAFYPGLDLNWDPTNWWGPNPAAVEGMLRAVGFRDVQTVFPSSRTYALARAAYRATQVIASATRRRRDGLAAVRQGRAAFHAFK